MRRARPDHWRDSYDYRTGYFKQNPGLMGCIWFCSQCAKPLWGRGAVQVDHIVPPSAFAHKRTNRRGRVISNTSFLARAMNSNFNTVAICPECNLEKSNKMGHYTAKGVAAKTGEVALTGAQSMVSLALFGALHAVRIVGKAAVYPLKRKSSPIVKILYIVVVLGIVLYLVRR